MYVLDLTRHRDEPCDPCARACTLSENPSSSGAFRPLHLVLVVSALLAIGRWMASKYKAVGRASFMGLVGGVALFTASSAGAGAGCPQGMWSSRDSCCELGTEYIESKNQCLPVRPERRCVEGHLDDCVAAGRQLEERGTIGAGYAAELYRYACDQGHAPACRGLGGLHERGLGVERDDARGKALYEQACAGGDARACTTLAEKMLGDESRQASALALFAQACHRGDPYACGAYGAQLARRPDQEKLSTSYFERACVGGIAGACRTLLSHARAERNVDPRRERELLERACRAADGESCVELGDAFRDGSFAPQSSAQAALRYHTACEGGLLSGCVRLADLTAAGDGVARDPARASELYGRACGAGLKLACERATELGHDKRALSPSAPTSRRVEP